ncbi:MAG TPA: hypothetical protein VG518_09700 [Solirubrobacterales bacterium]|nr:hypothetical protein [Solirubrobacterales bacterium]
MSNNTVDTRSEDVERLTFEDVEWMAVNTDLPPHVITFLHEVVLRREQGRPLELPPPSEPLEPEYLEGADLPPEEELEVGDELTFADLQWFEAHPDCPPNVVETLARVIAEREKRRGEELAPPSEPAAEEDSAPTEPDSAADGGEAAAGADEPQGPTRQPTAEELELLKAIADPGGSPVDRDLEEEVAEPATPEPAEEGDEDEVPEPEAESPDGDAQPPLEPEDDPPADPTGEGGEPEDEQGEADEPSGSGSSPEQGDVIITPGALELAEEEEFDLSGLIEARQAEAAEGKVVKITRASVKGAIKAAAEAA